MTTSSRQKLVAVGGPKGSGKSMVLRQALRLLPQFKLVAFGDWLNEKSQQRFRVDFPYLDKQNKTLLRKKLGKEIIELNRSLHVILDMHFGEFEEEGYPCVVPEVITANLTHLILITASPGAICHRRRNDYKTRRVDLVSIHLNILGEQLLFDNLYCYCTPRAKHSILLNNDIGKTTQELVQFLSN